MKKFILQWVIAVSSLATASAQNYFMTSPEGYGRETTGGGNATPVIVKNETELSTALTAAGPGVILIQDTIVFSRMLKVKVTDKTILGLPGAVFINTVQIAGGSGILALTSGSSNVIIRNLKFIGPGAYDVNGNDNLTVEANKLWVDHCEFQDGIDGNFDIKAGGDNITVSWCKFTYLKLPKSGGSGGTADHRFSNLVGSNGSDAPADGHYSVTYQCNFWAAGCRERMPRARNAEFHMLNCYYDPKMGAVAIGMGGGIKNSTCYVESTDFSLISVPYKNYNTTDGGTVKMKMVNCLPATLLIDSAVTVPNYNYTVIPVHDVASTIQNASCGAGATMKIGTDGTIGTTCIPNGLEEENALVSSISVYPNPSAGLFYIKSNKEIETLSIVNIVGKEVFKGGPVQPETNREITAILEKGVYMIRIRYASGSTEAVKFVKN